jgi:hypothetical protein
MPAAFSSSSVATRMKSVEWGVERSLVRILDMSRMARSHLRTIKLQKPRRWFLEGNKAEVLLLALQPGKTGRLPTADGTPMSLVIERPFKAARDVVTGMVTHCCHGLGRGQTSAS